MEGAPSDNLFVSGLPVEFDTEAIQQFFSACGNVTSCKSLGNGAAMVRFSSTEEAQMVRDNMSGQQPMGCPTPMTIKFARSGGPSLEPAPGRLLAPTPGGHKTMLCKWFMNGNQCTNGDYCKFAHGEEDMKEQGSWSGPDGGKGGGKSNTRTVQCKFYLQGTCQKGEECSFLHDDDPVESFAKGCLETLLQKIVGGGGDSGFGPAGGKGKGKVRQPGLPPVMQANGDWGCPECGDIQFARNPACRNCGSPKTGWASATPYGKGGGKGGILRTSDLIDGLIAEGLPGGNHEKDKNSLYITNLPFDTTDEDLYIIFASFGAIPPRGVRIMPGTPGRRLYGFVNFIEETNAEFAMMAMNGVTQPDGYKLVVKLKTPKENTGKGGGGAAYGGMMGGMMGGGADEAAGIDPTMLQKLRAKLKTGTANSAYDISQWYIVENLGHVTQESEMKSICDMLLAACTHLGLS